MNRREFTAGAGLLAMAGPSAAADTAPAYIELRKFYLRNGSGNQLQRMTDFLKTSALPAMERAGIGPLGIFTPVIAPGSPFLLTLFSYPSLAGVEAAQARIAGDAEYRRALQSYHSAPELPYLRTEASLLRAFTSMPRVEPPPAGEKSAGRVFELRTYESNTSTTLARKVKMFNEGEIAIFRRLGMQPVFFGETLYGQNLPNLTYMLSFDDLAARERLWKAFGSDPEWQKMRSAPGNADAEIVSNISNVILHAAPFSQIR